MFRTRRFIAVTVMVFAMLIMASGAQAQCDCNQDGSVSILDVLEMQRILAGLQPAPVPLGECDIDGVNGLTIIDVLMLAQFFSGSRPGLCPVPLTSSEVWNAAPFAELGGGAAAGVCEAETSSYEFFARSD